MQNLYSKLRCIQSEKNEKWVGEKVGCMLNISWFVKSWVHKILKKVKKWVKMGLKLYFNVRMLNVCAQAIHLPSLNEI